MGDRGLRGVKLVIADDHKGLRTAAAKVFDASQQRCRVHWMRNALVHAAPKQRPAVIAMLKTIFAQETAEAAHQQWEQVADALREKFPKLAGMMDVSREDVLAYMAFPREHWKQIASQAAGKGLQGDQAPRRCRRHLSQRCRRHPPRAGSCLRRKPDLPSGKGPRCKSLIPSHQHREREKVDDFYAARSSTSPPLPWSNFAPPFSTPIAGVIGSQSVKTT